MEYLAGVLDDLPLPQERIGRGLAATGSMVPTMRPSMVTSATAIYIAVVL
jgi:hypothetical protein